MHLMGLQKIAPLYLSNQQAFLWNCDQQLACDVNLWGKCDLLFVCQMSKFSLHTDCTAWCSEIGSLTLNALELHARNNVREPISLHQAVHVQPIAFLSSVGKLPFYRTVYAWSAVVWPSAWAAGGAHSHRLKCWPTVHSKPVEIIAGLPFHSTLDFGFL